MNEERNRVRGNLLAMGFKETFTTGSMGEKDPLCFMVLKLEDEEGEIHVNFNLFGTAYLLRKGAHNGELWFSGIDGTLMVSRISQKMRDLNLYAQGTKDTKNLDLP